MEVFRMRSLLRRRYAVAAHSKRLLLASTLMFLLLPAGCTGAAQKDARTASMENFLPVDQLTSRSPSANAEITFAQLKLYSALRAGDRTAILESSKQILSQLEKDRENVRNSRTHTAAALVDAAVWLISNDSGSDAVSLAERASHLLPDELPLVALQADLLVQQNRVKEGIALLAAFTSRHPDNEKAQAELALVLLRCGRADEAMKAFERIPEKKLTPQIRFAYAQALNSVRSFPESEKQLRAAVKQDPEYAEAWQLLALTLEEQKRPKESLAIYNKLLSTDPENRSARLFLIRHQLRANRMDAAVETIKDSPEPLRFAVAGLSVLMEEKKLSEAEELLKRLENLPDIKDSIYFYHAGMLCENGGDVSHAIDLLGRVPEGNAEFDSAIRLKVRLLCEQGRLPEAMTALEKVLEMHPDDVEPMLLKAELHARLQEMDAAEKTLKDAINAHPDNEAAHFQFAYLHEFTGRRAEAIRLMEDVVKRFPDNAMALNYVGYNLAENGKDLERAFELTSRAVALEPEADYIVDSLAWACFKLGRLDEAWEHIQRAIELSGSGRADPAMYEHYGDIALARKDIENARLGYERSYEIFLKHNLKDDAARVKNKLGQL